MKALHEYTNEDLIIYDRIRKILKDLHPKCFTGIDREIIERCGKRLEVFRDNALLLNTEHEGSVFFDYILYTYKISGINLMQKAFDRFSQNYEGEVLDIFSAAKDGYFAYLEILQAVGDGGLIVFDRERDTEYLMIDRGLNNVAKRREKHAIVTNIIKFDGYIITTGASTPVAVETNEGQMIQNIFDQYYNSVKQGEANEKMRLQYISDMYRTCFAEDITGKVTSPAAPFGTAALKSKVRGGSDYAH